MLTLVRSAMALVLAAVAVSACSTPPATSAQTPASDWEVCFTPPAGCASMVVKVLGAARSSVLVQAYSFTSASIAKALLDAHRRGVKIDVVLDKSQRSERYSSADFLARAGMAVKIDTARGSWRCSLGEHWHASMTYSLTFTAA
jgi:phosphatidylserine/phosphatidylglycerophosphate/cardiolipin synthase-like enzyme